MSGAIDRVLPHNIDVEKALLGAILMNDAVFFDVAGAVLDTDFYRDAHARIFRAMTTLATKRVGIDFLTLRDQLRSTGELDQIDGPAYLTALTDGMPRGSHAIHHAGIIRNNAKLRALIQSAHQLLADAYEADEDAQVVLDRAEQTLLELSRGDPGGSFRPLHAILPAVFEQIETWCRLKQGISGLASGFTDLDDMTRGFQPGNLIILAARPAMGKSALAMNIGQYVAVHQSVGMFSLEMSEHELAIRTVTAEAGIDGHRLQRGYVRDSEWPRLAAALSSLSNLKLYIDDSPFISAFEMRSRARRLQAEHGLALLIVDYTQLMVGDDRRENRTLELAAITRALKGLAKDLKIPVIALSQLSRKVEERGDKRPMLSDLRESGSLEQDADVVIFIFREAVYKETEQNRGLAELIIGKQRNGPTGTVRLSWIPEETRFANFTAHDAPADQRLPMSER